MDSTYITNIKVNHVRHLKDIEIPKDKEIFNCTETINIIEG